MKKLSIFLVGMMLSLGFMFGGLNTVNAQYDETYDDYWEDYYDDYDYSDYTDVSDDVSGVFGFMGAFVWVIWCCGGVFFFAMGGFTLWMIIHAAQNAPEDQKLKWILLMVFLGFIPALIYFFSKKKLWGKSKNSASVQNAAPAEVVPPAQEAK